MELQWNQPLVKSSVQIRGTICVARRVAVYVDLKVLLQCRSHMWLLYKPPYWFGFRNDWSQVTITLMTYDLQMIGIPGWEGRSKDSTFEARGFEVGKEKWLTTSWLILPWVECHPQLHLAIITPCNPCRLISWPQHQCSTRVYNTNTNQDSK